MSEQEKRAGVEAATAGLNENQQALLQMRFEEPAEVIQVGGVVVASSPVEGRKDILMVSIKFGDKTVPIAYRLRINNYLVNLRKHVFAPTETTEQKLAAAKAAQEKAVAEEKAKMEAEEKAKAEAAAQGDAAPAEAAPAGQDAAQDASAAPAPAQDGDAAEVEEVKEAQPVEEAAPADDGDASDAPAAETK